MLWFNLYSVNVVVLNLSDNVKKGNDSVNLCFRNGCIWTNKVLEIMQ